MENGIAYFHNREIRDILQSLGEYDRVKEGAYRCAYCGRPITVHNIDAIMTKQGQVRFICDGNICHSRLLLLGSDIHADI